MSLPGMVDEEGSLPPHDFEITLMALESIPPQAYWNQAVALCWLIPDCFLDRLLCSS